MKTTVATFALAAMLAGGFAATGALAQDDFTGHLKARQGQFRILALNLGLLGGMAKGDIAYDAEAAQIAADNMVTVTSIQQQILWPEGSDEMGVEGTRARTGIWDNMTDFESKWNDLHQATIQLAEVAGEGQQALGPAIGAVGGACKACHEDYRVPMN